MAAKKKAAATTGSAEEVQSPQPVAAVQSKGKGAQSPSSSNKSDVATNRTSDHTMTDTSSENILSYGEDISNAEAPPPLPDGEYEAEIRNATTKVSSSGNTMVPVTVSISPDHYPADYPVEFAPDGVTLTSYRLIYEDSARGRYRMRKFCDSIGAVTGKHINPTDWIGSKVLVTVGHEEYEGEQRNNIQKFSPLD